MLQCFLAVRLQKCFVVEKSSPDFPSAWGWVNKDCVFILGELVSLFDDSRIFCPHWLKRFLRGRSAYRGQLLFSSVNWAHVPNWNCLCQHWLEKFEVLVIPCSIKHQATSGKCKTSYFSNAPRQALARVCVCSCVSRGTDSFVQNTVVTVKGSTRFRIFPFSRSLLRCPTFHLARRS